jgi:hypothetical protein
MKLDDMHMFAVDLCNTFRIRYGPMDTENEMARELITLNLRLMELEGRLKVLERDRLRSYHREPSIHHMKTLSLPIDDNNWFTPEKDTGNA